MSQKGKIPIQGSGREEDQEHHSRKKAGFETLDEEGSEEKGGVSRISFSLRPELRRELDRVSKVMGFDDRSKALQIAIRSFISDFELEDDPDKTTIGTLLMLYEHDVRNIDNKITDIGHAHRLVIISSIHQHLDEENCLNIILVRGKISKILELEKEIRKLNGVKQLKHSYIAWGSEGLKSARQWKPISQIHR